MLNNPILNQKPIEIKRALISVYDKTGVIDFAASLNRLGVEILSTGGTSAALRKQDIPVTDVSKYTNFPEIMDGRVKTINPLIEGGILGLRDKHNDDAVDNKIKWIDLVVCNLYPFSKIIKDPGSDLATQMENIDIGGPTMIRSAAKNVGWVCVVVDFKDYDVFIDELNSKKISLETRRKLSVKAFGHTAQYDTIIHNHLVGGSPRKTCRLLIQSIQIYAMEKTPIRMHQLIELQMINQLTFSTLRYTKEKLYRIII